MDYGDIEPSKHQLLLIYVIGGSKLRSVSDTLISLSESGIAKYKSVLIRHLILNNEGNKRPSVCK